MKTKAGEKYHGDLVNVTTDSLALDSDERGFPGRVTSFAQAGLSDWQNVRNLAVDSNSVWD